MQRRWGTLGLALMLTLALTACGAKTEPGRVTNRLSDHRTSGTETSADRGQDLMKNGKYYAGADGDVSRRPETGESEWEKLGRELRESWDRMMHDTEDAAQDLERDARNAAQNAEKTS